MIGFGPWNRLYQRHPVIGFGPWNRLYQRHPVTLWMSLKQAIPAPPSDCMDVLETGYTSAVQWQYGWPWNRLYQRHPVTVWMPLKQAIPAPSSDCMDVLETGYTSAVQWQSIPAPVCFLSVWFNIQIRGAVQSFCEICYLYGLFMSNSQTYKLPDFLKSQTNLLIDFTVDLSRKSPTILKSQRCFLIWEFRLEQTFS